MSPDQIRDLVLALHQAWSSGDTSRLGDILAPDFLCHLPKGWGQPDAQGIAACAAQIAAFRSSFPDWQEQVHEALVEGPTVATRFTGTGTQLGAFEGRAPTGRRVQVDEMAFFRIADGKIAEQWFLADDLALQAQLN